MEKVNKELGESQNTMEKLAGEIGNLREEIEGLQSKLCEFFVSLLARSHAHKANTTSKSVEEK